MNIKQHIKNSVNKLKVLKESPSNDFYVSDEELLEILKGYLEAALWTEEEQLTAEYESMFDYSEDIDLGSLGVDDLDDNSKITFFNNHIVHPNKGDLILFPCEWFFIYKVESINNKKNNFIMNNVIKKF